MSPGLACRYVPVGAPCNVCGLDEWAPGLNYGNVARMNPDGTGLEQFASGIRNTVGFDWDPATNYMWMTNNGRDNMVRSRGNGHATLPRTLFLRSGLLRLGCVS